MVIFWLYTLRWCNNFLTGYAEVCLRCFPVLPELYNYNFANRSPWNVGTNYGLYYDIRQEIPLIWLAQENFEYYTHWNASNGFLMIHSLINVWSIIYDPSIIFGIPHFIGKFSTLIFLESLFFSYEKRVGTVMGVY